MPVLHLKNKVTRSMITTCEQALAVGAIPDCFTVTPKEGMQLLKEVQELKDVSAHFKFRQDDSKIGAEEPNLRFLMNDTTSTTRRKILDRWYQGLYTVSYVHVTTQQRAPEAQTLMKSESTDLLIPVRIVNPPKKKEAKGEEKDSKPST